MDRSRSGRRGPGIDTECISTENLWRKPPYFLPDGKLVIEPLSADAVEIEVEKGRPPFPVHADGITLAEQVKEKGAIISYHRPWVLTLDFTRGIHIG